MNKNKHCTCTGFWSCSLLTTHPPSGYNIRDRTKTFIKAYREAKRKNILTCNRFNPSQIGRKIDSFCDKRLSRD